MADLSAGHASVPPRVGARVAEVGGILGAMPGYSPAAGVLAAKLVAVFPRNTEVPTHQALIAVFDPATGTPVAVMDGEAITAARTAAGSALSIRLLARADAGVLAVLGTGVQARSHAPAPTPAHPLAQAGRARRPPVRRGADRRPRRGAGRPAGRGAGRGRAAGPGRRILGAGV